MPLRRQAYVKFIKLNQIYGLSLQFNKFKIKLLTQLQHCRAELITRLGEKAPIGLRLAAVGALQIQQFTSVPLYFGLFLKPGR